MRPSGGLAGQAGRTGVRRSGCVAGIVLAAGSSTRMGSPKALLDAGGMTFVARLVDTLTRGGCEPLVVVAAADTGPVAAEVARGPGRLVTNPGGRGGQIASLCVALGHLRGLDVPPAAVAFTPVDNPAVTPATVSALVEAWRSSRAVIVVPRYEEKRGHPVLADMAIAKEFQEYGLAEGARTVVRRDPGRVIEVPVQDRGTVDDLDTPGRYRARYLRSPGAPHA